MESQSGNCKRTEPDKPSKAKKPRKRRNNAESSSEVTVIMDEQIWEKLPEDVLEGVIARLPIATFFRFRLVCQKWNSLLHSHGFLQRCADVAQNKPWFYAVTTETVRTRAMYDPFMKKWNHFTDIRSLQSYPTASAGGLVCCFHIMHKSMYVCNPLTQTWKELPVVSPWTYGAVGMILNQDSASSGYRIIRLSYQGEYVVYDSLNNSWQSPGAISTDVCTLPIIFSYRTNTVSIGSVVYFLRAAPQAILSYDFVSGAWEQFLIPGPPNSTDLSLAECVGKILLMGLVKKNGTTSVCVWELERTMLMWKEVARMPNSWVSEFIGKSIDLICLGNKRLLMMLLSWRNMNRVFMYDAVTQEWSRVPKCLLPRHTRRQQIKSGVVFFPCTAASP